MIVHFCPVCKLKPTIFKSNFYVKSTKKSPAKAQTSVGDLLFKLNQVFTRQLI